VQCGQRRGGASLPLATTTTLAVPADTAQRARGRNNVNTTLIAGIGTLLLAMGVGVLIGRSTQKTPVAAAAGRVSVVTVAGAGSAASTPSTSASSSSKLHKSSKTKSAAAKGGAAATQAAKAHVKGADVQLPKQTVVKVGQKGHGPGYHNGKFTGDFFGGG